MKNHHKWHKDLTEAEIADLSVRDQKIYKTLRDRTPVSYDYNAEFDRNKTLGERVADGVASFGGSWTFIIIFFLVLIGWVILNSVVLINLGGPFDPFPYILLNLFLSMLASIQAPIILMSQNRQSAKDRMNAEHDYQVNLKAELEILSLHQKIDELRDKQWAELISVQQDQLTLLHKISRMRNGDGSREV
jgi:uncharacterized membrane protein